MQVVVERRLGAICSHAAPGSTAAGAGASGGGSSPPKIGSVRCSRPGAIYARGEAVTFVLDFPGHGGEEASGSLVRDALMEAPPPHSPAVAHRAGAPGDICYGP
jgi:hypothetical protein